MNHYERAVGIKRYWLEDEDDTPQRFPVRRLFREVVAAMASEVREVKLRRAQGYGLKINEWCARLEHADEICVAVEEFDLLAAGTDEWFYNLDAVCGAGGTTVSFGLHDSSCLYLEAPEHVARVVLNSFKRVRPA